MKKKGTSEKTQSNAKDWKKFEMAVDTALNTPAKGNPNRVQKKQSVIGSPPHKD